MSQANDYTYESAGFDPFLSRSIDNLNQTNLDSTGPASTALTFDRAQVSGLLGDKLRIGVILLDGTTGRIVVADENTNRVLLGASKDGTQGIFVSKEGVDVLSG